LTSALRSFLQYACYLGKAKLDLAAAVPIVANWSRSSIPRAIAADQIRQLLASIDRCTAVGCRDYAILLLLARLGLRSGEVTFLELDDIDWNGGKLSVRGKSGQRSDLPLPAEVGKAISLAALLERFFTQRLMQQRQASPHTISSYRDTFHQFLKFTEQRLRKEPSRLNFQEIDAPLITAFLDHLEKHQGLSTRSRNLRLTALRSFFRFACIRAGVPTRGHPPIGQHDKYYIYAVNTSGWSLYVGRPSDVEGRPAGTLTDGGTGDTPVEYKKLVNTAFDNSDAALAYLKTHISPGHESRWTGTWVKFEGAEYRTVHLGL
jgi:site-specific recombinase XerC